MKKDKDKDKILYTCKSILSEEEYANMALYYPGFYRAYLLRGTVLNIILVTIITLIILKNFMHGLVLFLCIEIIIAIINKVELKDKAKQTYRISVKLNDFNTEYTNYFHKDYFIRKNKQVNNKFEYKDLDKIIETDTNFYLGIGRLVFIFQKEYCNLELINHIRNINKKIYINKLGKKSS